MPRKYNKIQKSDGTVYIDLTSDTVAANKLVQGETAHNAAGEIITGTLNFSTMTWADISNTNMSWSN